MYATFTALRSLLFIDIISIVLPYKLCHASIEGRMHKSGVLRSGLRFYTLLYNTQCNPHAQRTPLCRGTSSCPIALSGSRPRSRKLKIRFRTLSAVLTICGCWQEASESKSLVSMRHMLYALVVERESQDVDDLVDETPVAAAQGAPWSQWWVR